MMTIPIWTGVVICLIQSAMFSGLNLAVFSVSRLRLEVEAAGGKRDAMRVLALRRNANYSLTTILWGTVASNVLLTILSRSVLTGLSAFFFSTVVITVMAEIVPQAYFARHAIQIASLLSPLLRCYQIILFPVAKPSAWLLDAWLGPEGPLLFRERDFPFLIRTHVEAPSGDLGRIEGIGALNFLDLDDIAVSNEGEPIDPRSVISLPFSDGRPVLPPFRKSAEDPFLRTLNASGKKWVIVTDENGEPRVALDAHRFLRAALFGSTEFRPETYWHRPLVVTDPRLKLAEVLGGLKVYPQSASDDVVDEDLIVFWGKQKRVISGSDLLGRLLRGIAKVEAKPVA